MDVTKIDNTVDWSFIGEREGKAVLVGYVPTSQKNYIGDKTPDKSKLVFGKDNTSGVTIATGFDIGQHSAAQLRSLQFVDTKIIAKLLPFVGKKKFEACEALHSAKGLKVDETQAGDIDRIVKRSKISVFVAAYDKQSVTFLKLKPFHNLHYQIRTAIMCFAFQYGEYGNWKGITASKYWTAITTQNFQEAKRILLEEYKTSCTERRRLEAGLYQKAGIYMLSETLNYKK